MGCPDVDIVVGGHTNTFLWNGAQPDAEAIMGPYPFVVTSNAGKKVPVVQAYAFTKYLGKINLEFDGLGNLVNFEGNPILLNNSYPEDEIVLTAIQKYQPEIDAIKKEIVGHTKVRFKLRKITIPISSPKVILFKNRVNESIISFQTGKTRWSYNILQNDGM